MGVCEKSKFPTLFYLLLRKIYSIEGGLWLEHDNELRIEVTFYQKCSKCEELQRKKGCGPGSGLLQFSLAKQYFPIYCPSSAPALTWSAFYSLEYTSQVKNIPLSYLSSKPFDTFFIAYS